MELVLYVCLINDPAHCKSERLYPMTEASTPYSCGSMSPIYAAQWAGEHPGWRIVKWRCGKAGGRDL